MRTAIGGGFVKLWRDVAGCKVAQFLHGGRKAQRWIAARIPLRKLGCRPITRAKRALLPSDVGII